VKLWWMQPHWGTRGEDVPPETQFLLLELGQDGPYAVIMPLLCDSPSADGGDDCTFRASLRGYTGGREPSALFCVAESGDPACATHTLPALLYVGGGSDPFEVVSRAFRRVSLHLGTFSLRQDKAPPPVMDLFGWCTWDAFYHGVSGAGVNAGLAALAKAGTPARVLILDDGWQTVAPDPEFRRLSLISTRVRLADAIAARGLPLRLLAWAVLLSVALLLGALATLAALDYPTLAALLLSIWLAPKLAQAASLASFAERLYWAHVHTLAYGSRPWRALAYLAHEPFVRRRIRQAAAALSTFNHRLTALSANAKFRRPGEGPGLGLSLKGPPHGLASVVAHAKEEYGVRYCFAWHALHGYWGGVTPAGGGGGGGALGAAYGSTLVDVQPSPGMLEVEPSLAWDPITLGGVGLVDPARAPDFYAALHGALAQAGVDGVKVDGQAVMAALGSGFRGGSALCRDMHAALNGSAARHFGGGNVINCMCHSTDNIYHFGDTAMCRASDDFFPRNAASWTAHIAGVAFNSLFLGEVVHPDWDMFHSQHPAAGMHAAARAVGGCAVYVSDAPGKHDVQLLRRLVLPDGSILRALLPGRPTLDCLFTDVTRDGRTALKVWNRNAQGAVVGCFNLQGSFWDDTAHQFVRQPAKCVPVTARVCPVDVPGLCMPGPSGRYPPGDYALYCHARRSLTVVPSRTAVALDLAPGDWEVVTLVPVKRPSGRGGPAFAAIGLGSMLNSGGAVVASEVTPRVLSGTVLASLAAANQASPSPPVPKPGAQAAGPPASWNSSARVVQWAARVTLRGGGTFVAFVNAPPKRVSLAVDDGPMEEQAFIWRRKEGGVLLLNVPEHAEQSVIEVELESDPAAAYV
jgi:raffinose synthase